MDPFWPRAGPPGISFSLENLIACGVHSDHQFDLRSRVQPRFTLFCLNNAGSEAIDNLSSARKWLSHGQKPGRAPGALARTGPARCLSGLQAEARPWAWSTLDGWELDASWPFPRRTIYWEVLGEREGRSCLNQEPAFCVGRGGKWGSPGPQGWGPC